MIRTFISVLPNGKIERHEEAPTHLIRKSATILEIHPYLASALVKVFQIDEEGERMEEVK